MLIFHYEILRHSNEFNVLIITLFIGNADEIEEGDGQLSWQAVR